MGSALRAEGREIWGFEKLGWYRRAWSEEESSLDQLRLTPAELNGEYGRVEPAGLLRMPAFAPFLRGLEPYTPLIRALQSVVIDPAAVLQFSYDWRLPVTHNAQRLALAAKIHLDSWRLHPAFRRLQVELPDIPPPRLVLVAHSMGGLLVRALPKEPSLDVKAVITLGTPFDGAPKALMILNSGRGGPIPLPREKLRRAAATMPGLHDLLPVFRCIDDPSGDSDPRRLTLEDVANCGGDPNLARASFNMHAMTSNAIVPHHRALVGTNQPTMQSLSVDGGVVTTYQHTFRPSLNGGFQRDRNGILLRVNEFGDGTVPKNSAMQGHTATLTLPQQHNALPRTVEGINAIRDIILESDPDLPRLGAGELGLSMPDLVKPQEYCYAEIVGIDNPSAVRVTVHDEMGRQMHRMAVVKADGAWYAPISVANAGIYTVRVAGTGLSPVSQMFMVDATAGLTH
jgi:hypothetical protein